MTPLGRVSIDRSPKLSSSLTAATSPFTELTERSRTSYAAQRFRVTESLKRSPQRPRRLRSLSKNLPKSHWTSKARQCKSSSPSRYQSESGQNPPTGYRSIDHSAFLPLAITLARIDQSVGHYLLVACIETVFPFLKVKVFVQSDLKRPKNLTVQSTFNLPFPSATLFSTISIAAVVSRHLYFRYLLAANTSSSSALMLYHLGSTDSY